jgi:hypothetical protein
LGPGLTFWMASSSRSRTCMNCPSDTPSLETETQHKPSGRRLSSKTYRKGSKCGPRKCPKYGACNGPPKVINHSQPNTRCYVLFNKEQPTKSNQRSHPNTSCRRTATRKDLRSAGCRCVSRSPPVYDHVLGLQLAVGLVEREQQVPVDKKRVEVSRSKQQ